MKINIYDKYLTTHFSSLHDPNDHVFSTRYFDHNFLTYLPKNKFARILDIGCGTGDFLHYLNSLGYINYLGIDISKEQIDYCKEHVTKKVQLVSNLDNFLIKNQKGFDFILMNDVIEHLPKDDIARTLQLINLALKVNGIVLIKTANIKNRWGMAVRYMDFTHTTSFSEESMRQVLKLAGFSDISIIKEIHPIHNVVSFFRILLKIFFEFIYRIEYLASFGTFTSIMTNMFIAVGRKRK